MFREPSPGRCQPEMTELRPLTLLLSKTPLSVTGSAPVGRSNQRTFTYCLFVVRLAKDYKKRSLCPVPPAPNASEATRSFNTELGHGRDGISRTFHTNVRGVDGPAGRRGITCGLHTFAGQT